MGWTRASPRRSILAETLSCVTRTEAKDSRTRSLEALLSYRVQRRTTLDQVFLSALPYHRWRAPVSGRDQGLVRAYFGELFLESTAEGGGELNANAYLPHRATGLWRAARSISRRRRHPVIDSMRFVRLGMDESITAEFSVNKGNVGKGDQIGMFPFWEIVPSLAVRGRGCGWRFPGVGRTECASRRSSCMCSAVKASLGVSGHCLP